MDYNFDRKLKYKIEDKYKSLYQWALTEHGEDGQQIGRDLIPWLWGAYFTATSCDFNDTLEKNRYGTGDEADSQPTHNQVIKVKLRPGYRGYGRPDWLNPTFSMFGTDRYIDDISLDIRCLLDPEGKETCTAWGIVSYTSENDFREETTEDCIGFSILVRAEKFERYSKYIRERSIDVINFSVGQAFGFYSDWTPSISTSSIKILVRENQEKVEYDTPSDIKLPVLGEVGEFRLWFGSRVDLDINEPPKSVVYPSVSKQSPEAVAEVEAPLPASPPAIHQVHVSLAPLNRVIWFGVVLLALILLRLLTMRG